MVLTCMWTTPSDDSLFNDHPMAHSMPGAGVVHHIIFDYAIELSLRADVRLESDLIVAGTQNDAMGQQRKSSGVLVVRLLRRQMRLKTPPARCSVSWLAHTNGLPLLYDRNDRWLPGAVEDGPAGPIGLGFLSFEKEPVAMRPTICT
jgi:hypothetical protein